MKKTYDIRINSRGRADAMSGIFDKSHRIVFGCDKPEEELIHIELPLCKYRIDKSDMENEARKKEIIRFLEKARKTQEKIVAESK